MILQLNGHVTYRRTYKELVEYLRGAQFNAAVYLPDFTSNQKRSLRQQAACFEEKDGILYHSSKDLEAGIKHLCRVVVGEEQKRLIRACHDGADGGHYGRNKTLSKVSMHDTF